MEFSYHILNLKCQQFSSSNSIISLKAGRSDEFLRVEKWPWKQVQARNTQKTGQLHLQTETGKKETSLTGVSCNLFSFLTQLRETQTMPISIKGLLNQDGRKKTAGSI